MIDKIARLVRALRTRKEEIDDFESSLHLAGGIVSNAPRPPIPKLSGPAWAGAVGLRGAAFRATSDLEMNWQRLYALLPGYAELLNALVWDRHYLSNLYTSHQIDVGSAINEIFDGLARGDFVIYEDVLVYIGHWYYERSQGVKEGVCAMFDHERFDNADVKVGVNGPEEYELERLSKHGIGGYVA